jgi:hypothetical protein
MVDHLVEIHEVSLAFMHEAVGCELFIQLLDGGLRIARFDSSPVRDSVNRDSMNVLVARVARSPHDDEVKVKERRTMARRVVLPVLAARDRVPLSLPLSISILSSYHTHHHH